MPIETTVVTTKSGHKVLRAVYLGTLTVADAQRYVEDSVPGGRFEHHGHLVLGRIVDVPRDVQKAFAASKPDPTNPPPVALVIESAVVRMISGLVMRSSENPNTEFFKSEPAALEWLDGAMASYEAKRRSPKR